MSSNLEITKKIEKMENEYQLWKRYLMSHLNDDKVIIQCGIQMNSLNREIKDLQRQIEDNNNSEYVFNLRLEVLNNVGVEIYIPFLHEELYETYCSAVGNKSYNGEELP